MIKARGKQAKQHIKQTANTYDDGGYCFLVWFFMIVELRPLILRRTHIHVPTVW